MEDYPREKAESVMRFRKKVKILRSIIYGGLAAFIVWQSTQIVISLNRGRYRLPSLETVTISVSGNVDRPGRYRVPVGTSQFEILQVAGVRLSSDISPFNLAAQIEESQDISVGTLDSPVSAKSHVRLEFYLGEVGIISADGRVRAMQEGMGINEGDRVICEEKSQAELSINDYSRADMDNFSELVFDIIGADEGGKAIVDIFHKTGLCWYKIVYSEKKELFRITTPLGMVTVGGKGADFTIDVKYTDVVVNNLDGLLLVERPGGVEAINLIAGQSVKIFGDARPLQVSTLAPEISVTERFSSLTKIKTDMILKGMPFNFLFCGLPSVFYFVSVQFEQNRVHIVRFPPQISVRDFAQGFNTLQQSYLYGGPVFASTFVERIINMRVPKYAVFNKDDVLRMANSLGGLDVDVDDDAATALKIPKGRNQLAGVQIVTFLLPSISGTVDSEVRQEKVVKAMFNAFKSKKIVITALLAEQILSDVETNIEPAEAVKHYKVFTTGENWQFQSHTLPIEVATLDGKTVYEPDLEKCQKLLIEN